MKTFKTITFSLMFILLFSCSSDDDNGPDIPENQPPGKATLTSPANNATGTAISDVELQWQQATDPDGDAVSYDIYLDGNNPPTTTVASGLNTTSHIHEDTLDHSMPYYWTVTTKDGNGGESQSDVFSFTTRDKTSEEKLEGFWVGEYGNGTNPPNAEYAFLFRLDGTVDVYTGIDTTSASKAEGTYTVDGSIVSTTYTYIVANDTYSTEASVNVAYDHMEGTWGNDENTTGGGTFYLDKQQE